MKNLTAEQLIEELKKSPNATVCICLGDDGEAYGIGQVINNDDVLDLVLNEEL